ncbi:efflux RND transporter permease subunit [Spirosoma radiotolerans]|uniref:Patched family protein n=1 Tax=Spirosoma radiotolerans TaxID=1379870 RepID=A0A0E3ZT52_9BACT|nr:MMPL family transporter [Spirosoma radiotolerans]AKD54723.1 patched family protein [Spirosoma radiotolerans]
MIWHSISSFILKNRILLVLAVLLGTVFMGYKASKVKLSYELAKILPVTDPDYQYYEAFKSRFGQDGNVMVLAIETDSMYQLGFFNDWYALSQKIKRIDGIKDVVSNANLYTIIRDDSARTFRIRLLVPKPLTTQLGLDSLKTHIAALPFYRNLVTDSSGKAHLMAISFDQKVVNTKNRISLVRQVEAVADSFGRNHTLKTSSVASATSDGTVHMSGMPYIRTEFTAKVSKEMFLFLGLAFLVTALILFYFFRSVTVVLSALAVVGVGVIWATGYIVLLGYDITLLTGLIPPLIIVIGVPNVIFLLNRYHEELNRNRSKEDALMIASEKVGETTFFANITTSIGFFVFYFTGSPLLVQFGLVAALGIMTTYAVSLILVPIIFSYLTTPTPRQRGHLERRQVSGFLSWVDTLVHTRRTAIYTFIAIITAISIVGALQINPIGFVVDDLPKNDPIYTDLKFIESRFKGVMPFEVSIDAKRAGRVLTPQTLTKIKLLEREFGKYPEFTRPLSLVEAVKFFYQAYRGGDPKYYALPGALELSQLANYAPQLKGAKNAGGGLAFKAYLDSTFRYTRISFQMPDVGTVRTTQLLNELQPKADSIFNIDRTTGKRVAAADQYDVHITGNSVVFTRGNDYLLTNLAESTIMAILLVSVILIILLRDVRLSLIAILPSVVPLLVTAGIMGFCGIHLKPSTILIFSIAFGISSDGTIYFITKYRDELRNQKLSLDRAVSETIRYTGISMFYTAMILFAGFAIFAASTFQGTVALGILVSITLLMGMASNLILLPAFLLTVDKRRKKAVLMTDE